MRAQPIHEVTDYDENCVYCDDDDDDAGITISYVDACLLCLPM